MSRRITNIKNEESKLSESEFNSTSEINSEIDEAADTSVEKKIYADNVEKCLKILYSIICHQKGTDGRVISTAFRVLPDCDAMPIYYKVIDNPIDLKRIGLKITEKGYTTIHQLSTDLKLMLSNAKAFNDPKSIIYKDAVCLQKLLNLKAKEINNFLRSTRKCTTGETDACKFFASLEDFSNVYQQVSQHVVKIVLDSTFDQESEKTLEDEEMPEKKPKQVRKRKRVDDDDYDQSPKRAAPVKKIVKEKLTYFSDKNLIGLGRHKLVDMYLNETDFNTKISLFLAYWQKYLDDCHSMVKSYIYTTCAIEPSKQTFKSIDNSTLINLTEICDKVKEGKYQDLDAFLSDVELLIANVMSINFPKSNIYQTTKSFVIEIKKEFDIELKHIKTDKKKPKDNIKKETNTSKSTTPAEQKTETMFDMLKRLTRVGQSVTVDSPGHSIMLAILHHLIDYHDEIGSSDTEEKSSSVDVNNTKEPEKRYICSEFYNVPPREEYPNYYQVIRKPMSIVLIEKKIFANQYGSMNEFMEDVMKMCENALMYNEINSTIYRDAITLAIAAIKRRDEIMGDALDNYPDWNSFLKKSLTEMFDEMCQYKANQDETCYQLLVHISSVVHYQHLKDEAFSCKEGVEINKLPRVGRKISLDIIRQNIQDNRYNQFIVFQDDLIALMKGTYCEYIGGDTKSFDAYHQMIEFYFTKRDSILKDGKVVFSEAANYTLQNLVIEKEKIKHNKLVSLGQAVDNEDEASVASDDTIFYDKSGYIIPDLTIVKSEETNANLKYFEQIYVPVVGWIQLGDYVVLKDSLVPIPLDTLEFNDDSIVRVERIWSIENGEYWFKGTRMVRFESVIVNQPTRLFDYKELIVTSIEHTCKVTQVDRICSVLCISEYTKSIQLGFNKHDCYVYSSRFQVSDGTLKKILKPLKMPKLTNESHMYEREFWYFETKFNPTKVAPRYLNIWAEKCAVVNTSLTQVGSINASEKMSSPISNDMSINNSSILNVSVSSTGKPKIRKPRTKRIKKLGCEPASAKASGYTMYSMERRKDVANENQQVPFTEITKILSQQYKNLPKEEREVYEQRAKNYVIQKNIENKKKFDENEAMRIKSQMMNPPRLVPMNNQMYVPNNQYQQNQQFPMRMNPTKIVNNQYMNQSYDKGINRSISNVTNGSQNVPHVQNNSFVYTSNPVSYSGNINHHQSVGSSDYYNTYNNNVVYSNEHVVATNAPPIAKEPQPLFVPLPKKNDKVFHSDCYSRYIERILSNTGFSSMKPPDNVNSMQIPRKLPLEWFENLNDGVNKKDVTKYLWELRDSLIQSLL